MVLVPPLDRLELTSRTVPALSPAALLGVARELGTERETADQANEHEVLPLVEGKLERHLSFQRLTQSEIPHQAEKVVGMKTEDSGRALIVAAGLLISSQNTFAFGSGH